jgi:hypothetical protein
MMKGDVWQAHCQQGIGDVVDVDEKRKGSGRWEKGL